MSTASFIRGLTASVLSNFSTLKRQAKRLQKESPRLVGRQLATEECQEIVAAIHGYHRWSDISEMSIRAGGERSLPFYSILSRTDAHEKILSALISFELELNESKPVVFLGALEHAAMPAYCLWAETISSQRVPGLILIETSASAIQDTALWDGITKLGMDEVAKQFRVIDAREKTLPVSISATSNGWSNALTSILPEGQASAFIDSGGSHVLREICEVRGRLSGWGKGERTNLPPAILKETILYLVQQLKGPLLSQLDGEEKERMEHDFKKYVPRIPAAVLKSLQSTYESMASWEAGLGVSIWHESEFRPTVVLFNRENQLSQIVAAVVHECFHGRYVSQRAMRPILYFSDVAEKKLPYFLMFGSNTVILNGIENRSDTVKEFTMSKALFCTANGSHLTFSGQSFDY